MNRLLLSREYEEKVYAGVLGKIIGVYLGRPFEGWTHQKILKDLGQIEYYVHERLNVPLIVVDDDITGTFTFLRAMPDYGNSPNLTSAQIGQTWLNYIIENRTILWWGGLGNSTEHTAFLRLKNGITAPRSGSMALNTKVVAEQIGAQIFIDGWGMISPGDPAKAIDLAARAARVSHDGEAVYAAQVIAAIEAQAFYEDDINNLLDTAVGFIPRESIIYRLIADIRDWYAKDNDWLITRQRIEDQYGYDKYGGNCHIVPNHAIIILSLLAGEGDFQKTLMIVNTCGWDTDCNSGNVGCLLGIKNSLAGLETGPDWRGPISDRIYLPTADGGSCINDALTQAYQIVNIGRALAGLEPFAPKDGARYHFNLSGSVQGFQPEVKTINTLTLRNLPLEDENGSRALALKYKGLSPGCPVRAGTPTFIPNNKVCLEPIYGLLASPSIYPGQHLSARVIAARKNGQSVRVGLYLRHYGPKDVMVCKHGESVDLEPGTSRNLAWFIPDLDGQPIAEIGIEITSAKRASGTVFLDFLSWDGEPDVHLGCPSEGGNMWRKAWVNAMDLDEEYYPEPYCLTQNRGVGMILQGSRSWKNYTMETYLTPHLVRTAGIAIRVQGLERYYALLIGADHKARLVKMLDEKRVLAETDWPIEWDSPIIIKLGADGAHLQAWIQGKKVFDYQDNSSPLMEGGIGVIVEEGHTLCGEVIVKSFNGIT